MFIVVFMLIACVVSFFLFQALLGYDLHWGACLALATTPVVATFFFGILGLLGSAFVTGVLFKASA